MNCVFSNPVDFSLNPATASASPAASWAFHTSYCELTASSSALIAGASGNFNTSMNTFSYGLFLAFGILLLIAGFWVGQWLFKR
jgi:hypothetical protein